ncbi:MAG TPA: hypothetical protein VHW01_16630 [Polyangiaceae bacterium]|nr:hypothetical protein [Polyangiaceae bacterium]
MTVTLNSIDPSGSGIRAPSSASTAAISPHTPGLPLPEGIVDLSFRSVDNYGIPAFADHYFGAVTGGANTVGISDKLGWSVIASAGGVMF